METDNESLFLRKSGVASRYGVTTRTIDRWLIDDESDFPQPVRFGQSSLYWKITDLEAWEAARSMKKAPTG